MDPILSLLARLGLAILFASAAYHKARDLPRFEAILADYRLLPAQFAPAAARLFIALELGLTAALALPVAPLAAVMAAALLTIYSLAIAINLARGRREIDCGCGGDTDQRLRPGLLVRNVLLIVVAIACALPVTGRSLSLIDGMTLVFGLASLALIWRAGGQLASFPISLRLLTPHAAPLSTPLSTPTLVRRKRTAP